MWLGQPLALPTDYVEMSSPARTVTRAFLQRRSANGYAAHLVRRKFYRKRSDTGGNNCSGFRNGVPRRIGEAL